jgi:hypothetical protein
MADLASDDLGAFLAANSLGAFAAVFAKEQITLGDVAKLSKSDLKELGIPMGPRVRILGFFATSTEPHRPEGLPASHGSPRHLKLQAGNDTLFEALVNSGKKYGCFLSHHKAACAMEGKRANHHC